MPPMTHPCAPALPQSGSPPAAEESGLSNRGQPASDSTPASDAAPAQVETPAAAPGANPVASRSGRAYEGVVQWVEDGIVSGRLRVGDVLPAERDLAAQLAVSRAVVREGVRALHAIGVVDSRVGAGAAGGTVITAVPTEALNRFLRMHVALAQFSLLDVVDVRCSLEGLSARLAARNATDADHARLADLITAMRDDDLPPDVFNACDTDFHVAIARAAGLPYVYLGYWVPGSRKMDYKVRFGALEIYKGGVWQDLGDPQAHEADIHPLSVDPIVEQVARIDLPLG